MKLLNLLYKQCKGAVTVEMKEKYQKNQQFPQKCWLSYSEKTIKLEYIQEHIQELTTEVMT